MSGFKYLEKKMAKKAGVSDKAFKTARLACLEEGKDWIHGKRQKVLLTQNAINKVLAQLGLLPINMIEPEPAEGPPEPAQETPAAAQPGDLPGSAAQKPEKPENGPESEFKQDLKEGIEKASIQAIEAEPGDVETLIVARLYLNKHILGALKDDQLVRVMVKSSKNFRKGMEIPARWISDDLYELARDCPRRPGKW